jgi:hypothetical protein
VIDEILRMIPAFKQGLLKQLKTPRVSFQRFPLLVIEFLRTHPSPQEISPPGHRVHNAAEPQPKETIIKGLIIMTTLPSQTPSFPGLTGESRTALDARLRNAGMTPRQRWDFGVCKFNNETLNNS